MLRPAVQTPNGLATTVHGVSGQGSKEELRLRTLEATRLVPMLPAHA